MYSTYLSSFITFAINKPLILFTYTSRRNIRTSTLFESYWAGNIFSWAMIDVTSIKSGGHTEPIKLCVKTNS